MTSKLFRFLTADAAASVSANSAKPNPFGRPVSLSYTRRKLRTWPTELKVWIICSSVRPVMNISLPSEQGMTLDYFTVWYVANEDDSTRLICRHFPCLFISVYWMERELMEKWKLHGCSLSGTKRKNHKLPFPNCRAAGE